MSVGRAALALVWICTPFWTGGQVEPNNGTKKTGLGSFADHGKVEFILISVSGLLPETIETVLLGVVVACTLDIVLVFLEEAEPGSVGGLGALFVYLGGGHGVT
jgi:hypothetical protein